MTEKTCLLAEQKKQKNAIFGWERKGKKKRIVYNQRANGGVFFWIRNKKAKRKKQKNLRETSHSFSSFPILPPSPHPHPPLLSLTDH